MRAQDENYFFWLSNWNRELAELQDQIAASFRQESPSDESTVHRDSSEKPHSHVHGKSQWKGNSHESRQDRSAPLREKYASLLTEYRDAYFKFAREQSEGIRDLREQSLLGELPSQCAFAVDAILESFFVEFDKLVDLTNNTVGTLLTLSEEVGLADQSNGDQEPLVGPGAVRLADADGRPSGVRAGNSEGEYIDGICARKDFTNDLALMSRAAVERMMDKAALQAEERAPLCVNGNRDYVYEVPSESLRADYGRPVMNEPIFESLGTERRPAVPADWNTEYRGTSKQADPLFWKVVHLDTYLRRLKSEARVITDHLESVGRAHTDSLASAIAENEELDTGGGTDTEMDKLASLQLQIRELRLELEPAFSELAEAELAPIEPTAREDSQKAIYDRCCAAVEAIVSRYAEQWGSVLTMNNNSTHLLIEFSSHLLGSSVAHATDEPLNCINLALLHDETDTRCYGIRVDDDEFRFLAVREGIDSFRRAVLDAIDGWVRKRGIKVDRLRYSVLDNHCPHASSD